MPPVIMRMARHDPRRCQGTNSQVEAGAAKILIDPFLSDNPSWDKRWSGYLAGKNATQGGDR
jgi:hypothetical protein